MDCLPKINIVAEIDNICFFTIGNKLYKKPISKPIISPEPIISSEPIISPEPIISSEPKKKEGKYIRHNKRLDTTSELWYHNGNLHRDNDLPAVITNFKKGCIEIKIWCINGKQNRADDKPARILSKMSESIPNMYIDYEYNWYIDDKLDRNDDKPASYTIIKMSEDNKPIQFRESWYKNGILHRTKEPAVINTRIDKDNNAIKYAMYWYNNGKLHRDNDEPAIITPSKQCWYIEDKLYRGNDKPATIIMGSGNHVCEQSWYGNPEKPGVLHRDTIDKETGEVNPAVIASYGTKSWYKNGNLHRDDDKPALMTSIMNAWYREGKLHRIGKPAQINTYTGEERYYQDGLLHNESGPAIIMGNGDRHWYCKGKLHSYYGIPAIERSDGKYEYYCNGKKKYK